MKRIIVAILLVATTLISVCAFGACVNEDDGYTLVAPDGAPALALAGIENTVKTQTDTYNIKKSVVSSGVISTEAVKSDIAIVPANLAANLYNKGNDIRLLAVVTNGNLFVLSNSDEQVSDLRALVGKMVYSIGQGSVPDMIFQSLLKNAGITYAQGEKATEGKVTIKYMTDGSEVMSQMALAKKDGENVFGVLAEPAVTNAINKQGFKEVFNLQTLWADASESQYDGYAQAVLIAKAQVCEDKEFVEKLLQAFSDNALWVAENPSEAVENIKTVYAQTSLSTSITADVVRRCNVKTIAMPAGKAYYEQMLDAVMQINANAIGGKLPAQEFYFAG